MPFGRLFVGMTSTNQCRLVAVTADELQAMRQTIAMETAGHRERGIAAKIERRMKTYQRGNDFRRSNNLRRKRGRG